LIESEISLAAEVGQVALTLTPVQPLTDQLAKFVSRGRIFSLLEHLQGFGVGLEDNLVF